MPTLRWTLRRAGLLNEEQVRYTFPRDAIHADVTKGLRYPDNSASYVYTSHMIEHVSRWRALDLLRDCFRVLRPGGVIRILTPDIAQWIREYEHGDTANDSTRADAFMTKLGIYSEQPGTRVQRFVRRNMSGAIHQWLYDFESLSKLVKDAGFVDLKRWSYREGSVPDLDKLEHHREGLHVEAAHPAPVAAP
ncbi:MAG: class I SAM-dependent methyltransferase [Gaiellaceae bacterium]